MLKKRVDSLSKALEDGVKFDGIDTEIDMMNSVIRSLQRAEKQLIPLRDSLVNEQAAKEQRSNEALLKDAGLDGVDVHDAVLDYIRHHQEELQSNSDQKESGNEIESGNEMQGGVQEGNLPGFGNWFSLLPVVKRLTEKSAFFIG